MKRYLLLGVVVLLVSANASLKEDFLKMDQAEDQMLSSMRTSVGVKDALNEDHETGKIDNTEGIKKPGIKSKEEILVSPVSLAKDKKMIVSVTSETNISDSISRKVQDEVKEKEYAAKVSIDKASIKKASIEKEKALKIEMDSKEAEIRKLKKAEEIATAKQLRVVEAYEKERAEKLAKEAVIKAAKKKEQEKKKLATKELEKVKIKENITKKAPVQEAKKAITAVADVNISEKIEKKIKVLKEVAIQPVKNPEVEKKILVKKVPNKSIIKEDKTKKALDEEIEVVSDLSDVNILRELEEKTKLANKAYEDAIKEMQEED